MFGVARTMRPVTARATASPGREQDANVAVSRATSPEGLKLNG